MITSVKQLKQLIIQRGGRVDGALSTDIEQIQQASRQKQPARRLRSCPRVRVLQTRRMSVSGLVIPAGTIGRMVSTYEGGIIANFGGALVRLPDGQATFWEVVK